MRLGNRELTSSSIVNFDARSGRLAATLFAEEVTAAPAGAMKATNQSHKRALKDGTAGRVRATFTPRGASRDTRNVFLDMSTNISLKFRRD
jgi:hypothetical protein